jgi:predicted nucleotidyltransferase
MPIFDQLSREAGRRGLRFLVIGAHAVMRHGYLRATEDADILVSKDERSQWEELVRHLGYSVLHDGGTFLQLTPAGGVGWELDLMSVSPDTFARMLREAKPAEIEGASVSVPSLEHLLALKLHALKHGRGLRNLKDMDDVIRLALANRVDLHSESFRLLVEKHGDKEIYERILRACAE